MILMLTLWILGSGVLTYALQREGDRLSTKPAPDTHETRTHKPKPITHYCGTCRLSFSGNENPPYGAIHKVLTWKDPVDGSPMSDVIHLHPITRIPLRPILTREESP